MNDELRVDGGSLYGGGLLSKMHNDSYIEEEMSFDELSSRLGGLQPGIGDAPGNPLPFEHMTSSARISEASDPDGGSTARESSLDFAAIPVMLGPLGKSGGYTDLPRFDYHLRAYSHRSVDKMT